MTRRGCISRRCVVLLFAAVTCLTSAAFVSPATAASGRAYQLLPPPGGDVFAARDTLRIMVSGNDGIAIQLMLDGMDVSAVARKQEGQLILRPPEPLAPGNHVLTLFESDAGTPRQAGQWSFTSTGRPETTFNVDASLNLSNRISEEGGDDSIGAWQVDGALSARGEIRGRGWSARGRADLLLTSNDAAGSIDGRTVDLGDFLFTAERGPIGARVGHHRVGPQSLVMRGFQRRGASLSWVAKNDRFASSAFAFRSEPVTGFRHGLGISRNSDRVAGAVVSLKPFGKGSAQPELSFTWLTGKTGGDPGVGIIQDLPASGGEAWSVALAAKPMPKTLTVRGEFAQSSFDFDRDGSGLEPETDDAWAGSISLTPLRGKKLGGHPFALQLGFEKRHVGTMFKSLANPGLPTDVDSTRGSANFSWRGLGLSTAVERQQNNSNDSPLLGTVRTDLISLALNYTSRRKDAELTRLGRPSASLSLQRSEQRDIRQPVNLDFDLDIRSQQLNASIAFQHKIWDWRLGYSMGTFDDHTGRQPDTRNHLVELGFSLRLGTRFYFAPLVQFNRIEDSDSSIDTDEILLSLSATLQFIPGKLASTLGFSHSDRSSSDDSISNSSSLVSLGLTWNALRPRRARPGVALWLKGQWQRLEGAAGSGLDDERHQVFIGVSVDYAR